MTLLPVLWVNSIVGIDDNSGVGSRGSGQQLPLQLQLHLQLLRVCLPRKRRVGRVRHTPTSNKPGDGCCAAQPGTFYYFMCFRICSCCCAVGRRTLGSLIFVPSKPHVAAESGDIMITSFGLQPPGTG